MESRKVSSIEPKNYIGEDVSIMSAKFETMKNGPVIRLVSVVIPLKGNDKLPEGKVLTASKLLGLKEDSKDKVIVMPEGGNAIAFCEDKGIDVGKIPTFKEGEEVEVFHGVECKVQKNDKNGFLDLV